MVSMPVGDYLLYFALSHVLVQVKPAAFLGKHFPDPNETTLEELRIRKVNFPLRSLDTLWCRCNHLATLVVQRNARLIVASHKSPITIRRILREAHDSLP